VADRAHAQAEQVVTRDQRKVSAVMRAASAAAARLPTDVAVLKGGECRQASAERRLALT
jgi:hypothetical protein